MNSSLSQAYSEYIEVMFQVGVDLQFWNKFINNSVSEFQQKETSPRELFSSLFGVYDIDLKSNKGYLKIYNETKSINTSELNEIREKFFSWVVNCSIVRTYIAIETAFIQTIWVTYFPELNNPLDSKKSYDKLLKAIKETLKESGKDSDTKNNRHLIEFFKLQSDEFRMFLLQPIRCDLKTDWSQFFELLSILRNIVSHIGTRVSKDLLNEIKGIAKDIFERHFNIVTDKNEFLHLEAIQDQFTNFLNLINDYTLNSLKIVRNEINFSFIEMK